jgi:hypothetical protein
MVDVDLSTKLASEPKH